DMCAPECVADVMQDIITIWNLPKIGIDNNPPDVDIIEPEEGDLFGGEQLDFEADVIDSNDGDVTSTITTGAPCYITIGGVSLGTVPYNNINRKCMGTIMIPEDEDFPQGTQEFKVEIADNAGNLGYATIDVEVDTVKPEVEITNPESSTFVKGTVTIEIYVDDKNVDETYLESNLLISKDHGNNWFPPDGCHELTSYECTYSWDTTEETEGMIFGLKAKVTDQAGNMGESGVVVVIVDNIGAEILAIVDPYEGEIVSGESVKLEAVASDFVSGINYVEFYIDDDYVGEDDDPFQGWKITWDSTEVDDGEHDIYAMAWDNVGHQRTSQTVTFIVDNDGPDGPDYIYHIPDEGVDYEYSNDDHVTWIWEPAQDEGSGIDYYIIELCYEDEECLTTKVADGGEADAIIFTIADLPNGCYYASVQAIDKAGHEGDWSDEDYVCVDTIPPSEISLWSSDVENDLYDNDGYYTISWSGGEDDNLDDCRLYKNGGVVSYTCLTPYSYDEEGIDDGTYVYYRKVTDDAGWETLSEEVTVIVDTQDPEIEITRTSGFMGLWALSYEVSDPEPSSGINRVEVSDSDTPFVTCFSGWCMVIGGSYVELAVYDNAGNCDTDDTEGAPAD
ncbi:MAG: hypothetical protein KAU24_04545, partial [Candidatus Aenigmarchaeota archaeon]|nr:hypothetical protein [Candidatus Aenigmarchaeota archaeon]